jgi:protein-disulfide isomerase
VALSKLVPSIEAPVRDCLELTLHKLVFPLPHPGALATVVLPVRLEVQPEGGLHAWLGEGGELRILDVHAAMRALAAEPVNKSRVPGAKGAPSSIDEGGDPVSGNADAPVTIVEFTDFQCSFCKKVNDTLLSLQNIYGDKVRFVFKQNPLPLHAQAGLAAEAALAANAQGKFAEYRKLLYYGGGDSLSRDELVNYALLAGLDIVRFTADLDANRYDAQIRADQAEAKRLNVLGVPTFYINGQPIQGAQPVDKFIEVIDAELAKH